MHYLAGSSGFWDDSTCGSGKRGSSGFSAGLAVSSAGLAVAIGLERWHTESGHSAVTQQNPPPLERSGFYRFKGFTSRYVKLIITIK